MENTAVKKRAVCRGCGDDFEFDWHKWAKHVIEHNDAAHKSSRFFAQKILANASRLNQKRDLPTRTTLTEGQKEAKASLVRDLCGATERVMTVCPKCKNVGMEPLPIEYTRSATAWRIERRFVFLCSVCREK